MWLSMGRGTTMLRPSENAVVIFSLFDREQTITTEPTTLCFYIQVERV